MKPTTTLPTLSIEPLSESSLFILLSLANGARHGYAILKEVATLSANRIELSTGTLYGALKRMVDAQWIERLEDDSPPTSARNRIVYRITGLGSQVLELEIQRMENILKISRLRSPQAPI